MECDRDDVWFISVDPTDRFFLPACDKRYGGTRTKYVVRQLYASNRASAKRLTDLHNVVDLRDALHNVAC